MNKEDEKFTIRLSIANMEFPVTIARKDEEFYRRAAGEINRRVNQYKALYAGLESERYLAMAAFDCAKLALGKSADYAFETHKDELRKLTSDIKDFLPHDNQQFV